MKEIGYTWNFLKVLFFPICGMKKSLGVTALHLSLQIFL